MNHLLNKLHIPMIEDYRDAYVAKKPADCILYSEDGSQFKIHKEIFGQTEYMQNVSVRACEGAIARACAVNWVRKRCEASWNCACESVCVWEIYGVWVRCNCT